MKNKQRIFGFGERLRKARRKIGWTQGQLAAFFGLSSKTTIANYEKGARSPKREIIKWVKKIERLTVKEAQGEYSETMKTAVRIRAIQKKNLETQGNQVLNFQPNQEKSVNFNRGNGTHNSDSMRNPQKSDIVNTPGGDLRNFRGVAGVLPLSNQPREGTALTEQEWSLDQGVKPRQKIVKSFAEKRSGFPCSFCGKYVVGADEYFKTMSKTLAARFIKVAKEKKSLGYFDIVLSCMYAIFGRDPIVLEALRNEGLLEVYNSLDGNREIYCPYCGNRVEDTIHFSSLKRIIISRLINLLKQKDSEKVGLDVALDCIHSIFGETNKEAKEALKQLGIPKPSFNQNQDHQ